MKIECIPTHHLRSELDEPFGCSQWYYRTRNTLWFEIIADDATTGWRTIGTVDLLLACLFLVEYFSCAYRKRPAPRA